MTRRRLLDKLWDAHEILHREDGTSLLWVDRHLVHEGSHHAFAKIAERGVSVAEPVLTLWSRGSLCPDAREACEWRDCADDRHARH